VSYAVLIFVGQTGKYSCALSEMFVFVFWSSDKEGMGRRLSQHSYFNWLVFFFYLTQYVIKNRSVCNRFTLHSQICYERNQIKSINKVKFVSSIILCCWSQWPYRLRRGFTDNYFLGLRVRKRHGCLSLVFCVLSGRELCDGAITRPEETCRVWSVEWVWSRNLIQEA